MGRREDGAFGRERGWVRFGVRGRPNQAEGKRFDTEMLSWHSVYMVSKLTY